MTLLQPATLSQSALRLALQGEQGSGKSLTATMIAVGLSKTFHNHAPIAFFDTEKQSDFVKQVCDVEGVPLLVTKSKSFIDMRDSFSEAEAAGCCAFIVDSYMHPYIELQEAFKTATGLVGRRMQFHHRDQPQMLWEGWTDQWKASRLHCLFASRLGFKWGDSIDEQGDVQKVRLGTRMRGDSDSGYEPNLVIEVESIEDMDRRHRKTRSKQGTNTHWLRVVKDRCMALNGRSFDFKELNGYTSGDFAKVFAVLRPHLDRLAINQPVQADPVSRSSAGLFTPARGESAFAERERRVAIAIEESEAALMAIWPGQTADEKRLRDLLRKAVFGSRSESAIKSLAPEVVEQGWRVFQHFEAAIDQIDPRNEAQVIDLITSCRDLERSAAEAMVT